MASLIAYSLLLFFAGPLSPAAMNEEVSTRVLLDLMNLESNDCTLLIQSEDLELFQVTATSDNSNEGQAVQVYLPAFDYQATEDGWILQREIPLHTKNFHPYFPRWTYGSEIVSLEYNRGTQTLVIRNTPAVMAPWRSLLFSCNGNPF